MKDRLYRIIDANLNRSREGLRVCEEIARFVLDDGRLTREFKAIRHGISGCIRLYPVRLRGIILTRDSGSDVGKGRQPIERTRRGWKDVSVANMERVKESLRVLEEFSKLIDGGISDRFKRLRFRAYGVEKRLISRF
jgi:thiamine-phosphate pyrophosphorylase